MVVTPWLRSPARMECYKMGRSGFWGEPVSWNSLRELKKESVSNKAGLAMLCGGQLGGRVGRTPELLN